MGRCCGFGGGGHAGGAQVEELVQVAPERVGTVIGRAGAMTKLIKNHTVRPSARMAHSG